MNNLFALRIKRVKLAPSRTHPHRRKHKGSPTSELLLKLKHNGKENEEYSLTGTSIEFSL